MIAETNEIEDTEIEFGAVNETWNAATSPTSTLGDQKTTFVSTESSPLNRIGLYV